MSFIVEARPSDSLYIETVMRGRTEGEGFTIRPAECHWHMVLVKYRDNAQLLVVGPLTTAGVVSYTEGAEILWIKPRLGTFMPHLAATNFLDTEIPLPGAASQSFWLKGAAMQFPNYENADTFVDRLVRDEVLMHDPVVSAVLQGHVPAQDLASRTLRHRFLHATGLTQKHIRQVERAQRAAACLRHGVSILDTVSDLGYFDQPHLTRSLKRWIGHTPAQIAGMDQTG